RIREAQLDMLPPANEEEFRAALAAKGLDLSEVRDANGQPVRVEVNRLSRYWDRVSHEIVEDHREGTRTVKSIVEPVTQAVITFRVMGPGRDTVFGTSDDLVLTEVIH